MAGWLTDIVDDYDDDDGDDDDYDYDVVIMAQP